MFPSVSASYSISRTSESVILSPIFSIAYTNFSTDIFPSWSVSKTLSASITSCKLSGSGPLILTRFSNCCRLNCPELLGSILLFSSSSSVSVGLRLIARIRVLSSLVKTYLFESAYSSILFLRTFASFIKLLK